MSGTCLWAHFILAEIIVLAGGIFLPAPAVPASTRISSRLNRVQQHSSPVNTGTHGCLEQVSPGMHPAPSRTRARRALLTAQPTRITTRKVLSSKVDTESDNQANCVCSALYLKMQSVLIMQCFIYKVSLLRSALYTKCPYYAVLYIQSVLIM